MKKIKEKILDKNKVIPNFFVENKHKNSGITLIALVITIIVLLILAGVSIAMLTGDNGILTQAQNAKRRTEEAAANEQADLYEAEDYINSAIGKTVNAPRLMEGMTPVYWDTNGNEIETTSTDTNWYNYSEQRWANAKTEDGSYWVWIPRYEYKVNQTTDTTPSDTNAGTVEVNFISKETTTASSGFTIHPAFTSNRDAGGWREEIAGIWVAKYEMSMEENGETKVTDSVETGNIGTSDTIKMVSKPGVSSWRWINIANSYTNSYNYDRSKESHLIKNSEWGAVVFLTHSKYGRNGIEVSINNSSGYYTAGQEEATATTNVSQSTTGNASGIYDISGGAWDRVAAFNSEYSGEYFTGKDSLDANGKHFASTGGKSTEYVTAYSNDTSTSHQDFTVGNVTIIGDGMGEVYVGLDRGWFNDHCYFINITNPFINRGGRSNYGAETGIFCSNPSKGNTGENNSFRVVLIGM